MLGHFYNTQKKVATCKNKCKNNLVFLDSKILSQEVSLNSILQKHVKISEYTQDLSKTSKDIYDLLKLLLMNSIVEQTKDIKK